MGDQLEPVLAAMAGGTAEPLGWFEYDVPSGAWTWSASLFQMHGFEPGEIVPTTAIFVSHKHPQDRQHTDEVLAAVLETGQPFCCRLVIDVSPIPNAMRDSGFGVGRNYCRP